MFDFYICNEILSYLRQCKNCKIYSISNEDNICCICDDFYCNMCSNLLNSYYGFFRNIHCKSCSKLIFDGS